MALALEQQTDQSFNGDNSTTEFNMAATVPVGSDLGLLVLVSWLNDDNESIQSLIWDPEGQNEALTKIVDYFDSDDSRVEAWYVHGPTAGASKNIEVIFNLAPLSTTDIVVCAYALSGAHPSAAVRDFDGEGITTGNVGTAVLSATVEGDFLAGCATIEDNATADWDDSTVTMTEVHSDTTQPSHTHAHGVAGAGSGQTLVATFAATPYHMAMVGVAILPGAPAVTYKLEGITKNLAGTALASCDCFLVKHVGASMEYLDYALSNGSGVYSFTGIIDDDSNYLVIAWKDDTPHVFDATDYVLTPVEE